jgi:AcrR family transcriptional regulator
VATLSDTPSLKERQRQERERLILRAASELLAERGYHDMSLEEIAARVGIAKGTIYLHFASKEDLVVALMQQGSRAYLKALDEALESALTPREKLTAVIDHAMSGIASHGRQMFMMILQNPEIHSRLADMRSEMSQQWEGPRRRLAAAIDQGKANGDFDPALPTPLIANLLTSLVNPHNQRQLIDEEGMTPDEIAAYLRRFFFKGIAAEPSECPTSDEN